MCVRKGSTVCSEMECSPSYSQDFAAKAGKTKGRSAYYSSLDVTKCIKTKKQGMAGGSD